MKRVSRGIDKDHNKIKHKKKFVLERIAQLTLSRTINELDVWYKKLAMILLRKRGEEPMIELWN